MAEEPRKRSRFDQTEPEPRRASRFDRRSRSPSSRTAEARRSRSPLGSSKDVTADDPAARAAAAAARINQSLEMKKGIQHVDVPPIRSGPSSKPETGTAGTGEVYTQDGDFIQDIEVNDLRNRYTLTKGATQKMIKDETGADVTTRGNYYPDKSMATAAAPPLYLHVTSTTKEGLEKAVAKINELMQQELPNLVDERRFRRREPDPVERDEFGRRKWPEERIPIDLEPIPGFNLRARVVGPSGNFVKHIQGETRCRVQIKGRGSGFIEQSTGQESDEPMFLHVAGPDPQQVQNAKEMCIDLLGSVREQYEQFKDRGPPSRYGGGGDGGRNGNDNRGYENRGQRDYQSSNQSAMNPMQGDASAAAGAGADYNAQLAAYYASTGQDPYAQYGGYENYVRYYYSYMQQQQAALQGAQDQQQQAPPPPPPGTETGSEAPPPPPPTSDENAAPPPPRGGGPPGTNYSYNAVPPPPGL